MQMTRFVFTLENNSGQTVEFKFDNKVCRDTLMALLRGCTLMKINDSDGPVFAKTFTEEV